MRRPWKRQNQLRSPKMTKLVSGIVCLVVLIVVIDEIGSLYNHWSNMFHLVDSTFQLSNTGMGRHIVENGVQTQTFVWNINSQHIKNIVIPDDESVTLSYSNSNQISTIVKKSLQFHGHPPADILSKHWTSFMGLCYKLESQDNDKDTIIFGTFGEFTTREGGARIQIHIDIPQSGKSAYHITTRVNLNGAQSEPNQQGSKDYAKYGSYFYGVTSPGEEWTIVA